MTGTCDTFKMFSFSVMSFSNVEILTYYDDDNDDDDDDDDDDMIDHRSYAHILSSCEIKV